MIAIESITTPSEMLAACPIICPLCGGDGKETCDNPDHGFIKWSGGEMGRLGCPVCGHDENHKVRNGGPCEVCDGEGTTTLAKAMEYAGDTFDDRVDYFEEPARVGWLSAARELLLKKAH